MSEQDPSGDLGTNEGDAPFESALPQGRQRFLAHVIEHALAAGRRTHDDFMRHFTPTAIMEGLKNQPQLRANILVITTGVKTKIARKKDWESAGNDLQIALDEGEADAETIVSLFEPDDRVRYLDGKSLWKFVVEGDFWRAKAGVDFDIAKAHTAFMLDRALKDELIAHKDIVDGITVSKLSEHLPRIELEKIITAALRQAEKEKPFHETDLLRETPSTTLVDHIPLPHIWETVIEPRIAGAHKFLAEDSDSSSAGNDVDLSAVSDVSDDDEIEDEEDLAIAESLDDDKVGKADAPSNGIGKAAPAPAPMPSLGTKLGLNPGGISKPTPTLGGSDAKLPSPTGGVFGNSSRGTKSDTTPKAASLGSSSTDSKES